MKIKVKIVKLGKQRYDYVFKRLSKYKSNLFEVEIEKIDFLPNPKKDNKYSDEEIKDLLEPFLNLEKNEILISFLDYEIDDDFYARDLIDNKVYVASFFQVFDNLKKDNLNIFNYVVAIIYRFIIRFLLHETITHDEARGCLNDMCEHKPDIIYFCNKPTICPPCEEKMKKKLDSFYINNLKLELGKIKKATYYIIADFIINKPILSIIIGIVSGVLLSILSNFLYDFIIKILKR
ncbi:MAG: hypothetical protein PHS54_06120 [Clostridia bacterium]|nr:hypothetical protein [Clostridia bacterium]